MSIDVPVRRTVRSARGLTWASTCATAVALLLPHSTAAAQALRVRVIDQSTGTSVPGTLISLLDSAGRVVVSAMTPAEGARLLAVPGPGSWRVLVRRIGFSPATSAPVRLAAADTVALTVPVSWRRVTLAAVRVRGRNECGAAAAGGERLRGYWEAITTALASAEVTRRDQLATVESATFRRVLDRDGGTLMTNVTERGRTTDRPFSAAAPDSLARFGYVRLLESGETEYFAPDERVLLSDVFVATHCFGLTAGRAADRGLVGLTFAPVRSHRRADVKGTLWVDPETSELRRLSYEYTNFLFHPDARGVGGEVHFRRLPNGSWIVSDWRIRMPRLEPAPGTRYGAKLDGYVEVGGTARTP